MIRTILRTTMTTTMATEPTLAGIAAAVDRVVKQLTLIAALVNVTLAQGEIEMAIGQDILDAVAAETTAVDSVIEYVKGLIANNVVTAAEGQKILANLADNRTKLEAAITTGVVA